ncbi:MAG: hypothetical protein DRN05_04320, partial [Thermoplasmata archaeon]
TIDTNINGSFYNITSWQIISSIINGTFINTTAWKQIGIINGTFTNTTIWKIIQSNINGTFYNQTPWNIISTNINGSFVNSTKWTIINATINGTFTNQTTWHIIDKNINGSFKNFTQWNIITTNINGSFYNITTWNIIQTNINGTFFNISILTIHIVYPKTNATNINPNGTALIVNISNPYNHSMNLTFYTNITGSWQPITTNYTTQLTNLKNGTYLIYTNVFKNYSTKYYWYANVTDVVTGDTNSTGITWFTTRPRFNIIPTDNTSYLSLLSLILIPYILYRFKKRRKTKI